MQPQLVKVISFRHRKLWKSKVKILIWKSLESHKWQDVTEKILSLLCILLSQAETPDTLGDPFRAASVIYCSGASPDLQWNAPFFLPTLTLYCKQCPPAQPPTHSSPLSSLILADSIISKLMDFKTHIHNSVSGWPTDPQFQSGNDWGWWQASDKFSSGPLMLFSKNSSITTD